MTTFINASTSAGLVQTADTSGNLSLQSGGTTILALTSAGAAVTGTLSAALNGTVGATTPATGTFTNVVASGTILGNSTTGGNVISHSSGYGLQITAASAVNQLRLTRTGSATADFRNYVSGNAWFVADLSGTGGSMSLTDAGYFTQTGGASLCTTAGTILDVGTADVNIGYVKTVSILATTNAAGIVCKVPTVGYPILAAWNSADSGDNIFQYFYVNAAGDNKGSIAYNRAGNVIAYNTTSDATLKNLIGDAPQAKSLSILSNTRLREYSWKSDETNKPQIGVIAQELVDVFPGAVSVGGDLAGVDEDGNPTTKYHPWSVDKTAYQFHLVAGWQSHEAKIEALEARLAALETK
jgi:hypothetical protein